MKRAKNKQLRTSKLGKSEEHLHMHLDKVKVILHLINEFLLCNTSGLSSLKKDESSFLL